MRFILSFILLMLFWSELSAQTDAVDNFTKYQYLRSRLVQEFIEVGSGSGKSIPAAIIDPRFDSWADFNKENPKAEGLIRWGDATIYLGDYLAVLATEYALYKENGLSTRHTIRELHYGLQAFNRLDSIAEYRIYDVTVQDSTLERNGFFIRDDVDQAFVQKNFDRKVVYSDNRNLVPKDLNAMSQDQVVGMLFGLAMVTKFVEAEVVYQDVVLRDEAVEIAHRMVRYLRENDWVVNDPIHLKPVKRGPNAVMQSYPIAEATQKITGINYQNSTSRTFSKFFWKIAQFPMRCLTDKEVRVPFSNQYQVLLYDEVNNSMMMKLACLSDTWRYKRLRKNGQAAHMEMFILANEVLGDKSPSLDHQLYLDFLDSMPMSGSYYYNQDDKAPNGWATTDRWIHPDKRYEGSDGFRGQYVGLDYMILFNLYHLGYNVPLRKNQSNKAN